jgi:glycogen synthase
MKVLIYTHPFAPIVGGAEKFVMLLAQGLSSASRSPAGSAVDVTVATPTPANGFDDYELPFRVVRRPNLVKLASLLREADVIQLAGPCFLPLLLGWLLRKPVAIEHHGYPPVCPNGMLFFEPTKTVCPGHFMAHRYGECLRCNAGTAGWLGSLRMLLLTFPRRWLCRRIAANAPISEHVRKRLELPRSQVIYYGIPDAPSDAQLAVKDSSNGSPLCFGYVGRLVSLKGLPLVLEAAKQLRTLGYDFRLKFIGDGPEQAELKRLVGSLGLTERVAFTGFVTGDAFERAMDDVAAVLMPSIWEETAGLAAIEQMMRGRLVIASDIGGLGEVVGDFGLRFPAGSTEALAECMRSVLDRPETIVQHGAAARRRALDLFSQQRMVNDHLELYGRLAPSAGPREKAGHPALSLWQRWRMWLGQSYWAWRLYHLVVADAVSIQRPTKYRIVYEFLGSNLGRTADIGCGPGVFTRYLCEHAAEVYAADIDEAALARVKARHRDKNNLGCVVTFADCLPFPDGRLDTVLLLEVLEHLTDDDSALKEIWRVMRPGGRLILSVPVPPGEVNDGDPWGHKREGYELHGILKLVENNGFEVETHRFAMFKFSRLAERLIRAWRESLRLPAPIFLSWLGYLDRLLDENERQEGGHLPANVVLLARRAARLPKGAPMMEGESVLVNHPSSAER